ncbi:hypothetical protein VTK26DRAFT_2453 [Humicola hyalothermophila]
MTTPSLNALPIELLVFVVDHLDHARDLAAVARMSRRLHDVANPRLYRRAAQCQDGRPLAWAARHGLVRALKMALGAGSDPNHIFVERVAADELATASTLVCGQGTEVWDADNRSVGANSKWSPGTADDSDHAGSPLSSSTADQSWRLGSTLASSDQESVTSTDGTLASVTEPLLPQCSPGAKTTPVTRRFTALHVAASHGHNEVIETLLSHGARINAPSERYCTCTSFSGLLNDLEHPEDEPVPPPWTPLHVAICHSRSETAKLLLSHKASPSMVHWDEDLFPEPPTPVPTALHHAAAMGLADLARHIVSEAKIQTDVNLRDHKSLTPFYHAYARRRWDSTVPLLLALGADIDVEVKMYIPYCAITPLGEACRLGDYEVADRLLDLGADARHGFVAENNRSGGCLTPLHMCCMRSARGEGDPPAAAGGETEEEGGEDGVLPDDGVCEGEGDGDGDGDHDEPGKGHGHGHGQAGRRRGRGAGAGAARMRTIAKLIAHGAEMGVRDCFGSTPLMAARKCGNRPAIRALLAAGAEAHEAVEGERKGTVGLTRETGGRRGSPAATAAAAAPSSGAIASKEEAVAADGRY